MGGFTVNLSLWSGQRRKVARVVGLVRATEFGLRMDFDRLAFIVRAGDLLPVAKRAPIPAGLPCEIEMFTRRIGKNCVCNMDCQLHTLALQFSRVFAQMSSPKSE